MIRREHVPSIIDQYPVCVRFDPLLYMRLYGDCEVLSSPEEFREHLDDPSYFCGPTLVMCDNLGEAGSIYPLQTLDVVLSTRSDEVIEGKLLTYYRQFSCDPRLLQQSRIASSICHDAKRELPDVLVLAIIDGLSYSDQLFEDSSPCIVDGLTTTSYGMRRIVKSTGRPLAVELHMLGYTQRLGFSYWSPENERLTGELFEGFSDEQFRRLKDSRDVFSALDSLSHRTFVQIVREGLDGYAHRHRDRPLSREAVVVDLRNYLSELVATMRNTGLTANIYLTSDHGILWADDLTNAVCLAGNQIGTVRYYDLRHDDIPQEAYRVGVLVENHSFLALPKTHCRRKLSALEWGTHGGISFDECVTPFIVRRIR
ncbi:MAG TPA: PglZ domain-containing protein [Bacillota bacterium]|jgi:hypothetical protein|nr:PglZ domain-containing protein [Bacillota bacterium]